MCQLSSFGLQDFSLACEREYLRVWAFLTYSRPDQGRLLILDAVQLPVVWVLQLVERCDPKIN